MEIIELAPGNLFQYKLEGCDLAWVERLVGLGANAVAAPSLGPTLEHGRRWVAVEYPRIWLLRLPDEERPSADGGWLRWLLSEHRILPLVS